MSKETNTKTKRILGDRIEGRIYEKRMSKIDVIRNSEVNKLALNSVIDGGGYNMDSFLEVLSALDLEIVLKVKA